jgi:hypothetical protein
LVTLMLGPKADPAALAKLEEPASARKGNDAAQTFFETRNTQQVRRRR